MGKESGITTIAFAGNRAERFLTQHGVAPERFVVGIAGEDAEMFETTVGKVGVCYTSTEVSAGVTHNVLLDLTDVAGVPKKRVHVSIGAGGYGVQELGRGLELIVATSVERTLFKRKER